MNLGPQLPLDRCPHCAVARPNLASLRSQPFETNSFDQKSPAAWSVYACGTCGGVVLAKAHKRPDNRFEVSNIWPKPGVVFQAVPPRARAYLSQALSSISAPAGAVMLAASAVDSMLKEKGHKEGSLYSRIDAAAAAHLITAEMAAWAHEIRLDANDQRHADDTAGLPTSEDAQRVVGFAQALAEFLFVLPARVQRGRAGQKVVEPEGGEGPAS